MAQFCRALDMDFSSLRKQPFCPHSLARSEEKRLFTQARILEDATFVGLACGSQNVKIMLTQDLPSCGGNVYQSVHAPG